MTAKHTQAATMRGQRFHMPDAQTGGRKDALDGCQRQVGEVLMVDRVELVVLQQLHQMGELQRDGALGLERCGQTAREVIDVGHMGEDVVARDQVGLLAPGGQQLT